MLLPDRTMKVIYTEIPSDHRPSVPNITRVIIQMANVHILATYERGQFHTTSFQCQGAVTGKASRSTRWIAVLDSFPAIYSNLNF